MLSPQNNYETFSGRGFLAKQDDEHVSSSPRTKAWWPLWVAPLLLGGIALTVLISLNTTHSGIAPMLELGEKNMLMNAATQTAGLAGAGVRTLILMRHASAVQLANGDDADEGADAKRELDSEGVTQAKLIGHYLAENRIFPDYILCSTAVRTRQTLDNVLLALDGTTGWSRYNVTFKYDDAVYTSKNGKALLELVRGVNPLAKRVLVIGHNPAIEELAQSAMGHATDPQDMLSMVMGGFAPASIAVYAFRCATTDSWNNTCVGNGKGTLTRFVDPAALPPLPGPKPSNPFLPPKSDKNDTASSNDDDHNISSRAQEILDKVFPIRPRRHDDDKDASEASGSDDDSKLHRRVFPVSHKDKAHKDNKKSQ